MKRSNKLILGGACLLMGATLLSSCTASFCSVEDKAHMLYVYDYGVTAYYDGATVDEIKKTDTETVFTKLDGFNDIYVNISFDNCGSLKAILDEAKTQGLVTPTLTYYAKLDELVLANAVEASGLTQADVANYTAAQITKYTEVVDGKTQRGGLLDTYGYLKFYDSENKTTLFANWKELSNEVRSSSDVSIYDCPNDDFVKFYENKMNTLIASFRSCVATSDGYYGYYGKVDGTYTGEIFLEGKDWGYAWKKGLLEGLLIYPLGWLIDTITGGLLNGGIPSGVAQLLSILIITVIVRSLMILLTFKSTAASAKLNELQPEIAKIQAKYPHANENQNEKMRLADETQKLYKKHGINPFSSIITMIIQFPVFICVWGALSGSALLSSGSFLGLNLSDSISAVLFNARSWSAAGGYAGVTALVLFILMAAAQVVSMLLPQWIQKIKQKKVAKLGRNPAKKSQDNKMKWFTYIMMIMIIFMGFSLASGMGVYWFVGALISVAQTLITQSITSRKKKGKK